MSSTETDRAEAAAGETVAGGGALQALLDGITAELGDALLASELRADDLWVRVAPQAWRRTAEVCRHRLGLDYFCFLSGIDWMPSAPNPEDAATGEIEDLDDGEGAPGPAAESAAAGSTADESGPDDQAAGPEPGGGEPEGGLETGVAGGDTRFQVLARLYSTSAKVGVTLKADLDEESPRIESWASVYRGADWHERETWEMYGFDFPGHPGLRHMYLPGAFEGHPLRKDFPLLAREVKPWPGLVDVEPMPETPEEAAAAAVPAPAEGGAPPAEGATS